MAREKSKYFDTFIKDSDEIAVSEEYYENGYTVKVYSHGGKEYYKNRNHSVDGLKLIRIEYPNGSYEFLDEITGCWEFHGENRAESKKSWAPNKRRH